MRDDQTRIYSWRDSYFSNLTKTYSIFCLIRIYPHMFWNSLIVILMQNSLFVILIFRIGGQILCKKAVLAFSYKKYPIQWGLRSSKPYEMVWSQAKLSRWASAGVNQPSIYLITQHGLYQISLKCVDFLISRDIWMIFKEQILQKY